MQLGYYTCISSLTGNFGLSRPTTRVIILDLDAHLSRRITQLRPPYAHSSSIDLSPAFALSPLVELAAGPSDRSPNPGLQQNPIPFLASRLIFLTTAVPSILVIEVIEKTELISCFERSFKHQLLNRSQSQVGVSHPSIPEDLLIKHLMVHYPKSVLQFGQPTSPTIGQSPFTSSSDSNGSIDPPVSPSRRASFKTRLMNQISIKITRRARSEASNIKEQEPLYQISAYHDDHRPSHSKNSCSPHNRSHSKTSNRVPSVDQDLEGLDNVIDPHNHVFAGSTSSSSPSDYTLPNESNRDPNIPPAIAKLVNLIDQITGYYCPGDHDDQSAKEKWHADSIDLEVDLTQILLLTANLISPHTSPRPSTPIGLSKKCRDALIERFVSSNIDRSVAFNKQDNLIGHVL
ncbi:hypothetical protein PGTUg99_003990 [Puccinia graminis f. sp. tritici]|uniref:Uncharacterized protein n=1 Tax=Puccinia graminis f. sp. tritici TaxID=56615 RepID=A0A5B0S3B8_PUCGR|nr:hypothetical protein PGTUg99_000274 [Puccinia graminis f. sp. tritici]KAA1132238.1 hypothetical protein PGTUg99_003990 [Puccinia graminis f. sp. tritici]